MTRKEEERKLCSLVYTSMLKDKKKIKTHFVCLPVILFCLCVKAIILADDAEAINSRLNIRYRGDGAGARAIRTTDASRERATNRSNQRSSVTVGPTRFYGNSGALVPREVALYFLKVNRFAITSQNVQIFKTLPKRRTV